MSKLVLTGLGKNFGAVPAVADVNLALRQGEFVSLLGPSGCGKTTTLRMIAGFIQPTAGSIAMNGAVLSSASRMVPAEKRGMSMIFQSYAIWPHMTVGDNVAFGLKLRRMPQSELSRRLDAILQVVQMAHLKDRYPSELSGGQQQRVALARAIVIEPEVLLLDEPLSNLDANLREEMRSEIRRLHDAFRITTVYVTHDQAEAMATSDRIVVMNHGKIEQVDDPQSLYNRPRTRFVAGFIGRTNLLEGDIRDGAVNFAGFSLRGDAAENGWPMAGRATFSIRPQCIAIRRRPSADADGAWSIKAHIVERAYLGERWDYVVQPAASDLRLRVVAPPFNALEVGDEVRLEIDPRQVAPLAEPDAA